MTTKDNWSTFAKRNGPRQCTESELARFAAAYAKLRAFAIKQNPKLGRSHSPVHDWASRIDHKEFVGYLESLGL